MTRLLVPLAFSLLLTLPGQAAANDVEPRLFTNIPVGTNFLAFSYTRSEGNVAVDPSLALDVDAGLDTYVGSYSRAFGIGGKSATATVAVPYADLQLSGIVDDEPVSANRRAMADPLFRIAVNLAGAPDRSPSRARPALSGIPTTRRIRATPP